LLCPAIWATFALEPGVKLRAKILFVLIILLVLGFIFLLPHGRYRHELEAYKKELRARGEKLTIAELAPPPSSNPSNGAKAFMQLMKDYELPTNLPTIMRLAEPGLANVTWTNLSPEQMVGYEENRSKVVELRKLLNASVLDFQPDYARGQYILLPHAAKLKATEQLIAATAMQACYAREFSEGVADLVAAANLVRLYGGEVTLISDFVRAAMARTGINATWAALHYEGWTETQLLALQNRWQVVDLFSNAAPVIAMEGISSIASMDEVRQTNMSSLVELSLTLASSRSAGSSTGDDKLGSLHDVMEQLFTRLKVLRWKSSWSYDEELCYLEVTEAALESARKITADEFFVPEFTRFNQQANNIFRFYQNSTNEFMLLDARGDYFRRYLSTLAEVETARRLCVTAIALKRYQLQHGAYPTMLNDLVPAYLSAVPIDFMDGKPLRYKLRPDGDFLLYSVGDDGKDDGGDPTPVSQSTSFNWMLGRDIVWPRVATPAALEEYHRLSQSVTNVPGQ
jgi:hypothetical protein